VKLIDRWTVICSNKRPRL